MALRHRIDRVQGSLGTRIPPDQFMIVILCPVAEAEGHPPGLYHDGPAGSRVGVLVYDPEAGPARMPADRVAPCGRIIGGGAGRL